MVFKKRAMLVGNHLGDPISKHKWYFVITSLWNHLSKLSVTFAVAGSVPVNAVGKLRQFPCFFFSFFIHFLTYTLGKKTTISLFPNYVLCIEKFLVQCDKKYVLTFRFSSQQFKFKSDWLTFFLKLNQCTTLISWPI